MNNVIKTSSKGARQGGIGLNKLLNEGIFTNVIYYSEFADGRKYVGQTIQGFLRRHKDHMRGDRDNNHYNNVLQKHMDDAIIYPICFGVEDIEDINTVDLLNGLEVAEIMLRETFNDVNKEHGLNHTTGGYSHKKSQALKERYSKISTNTGIYNLFKKESKDVSQGFRWIYKYSENGNSHEITSVSLIEVKEKVLSNNLPWTILDEDKANEIFDKYGKSKDQMTWKFGIKNVSKVKMNNKQGFAWMYTTKVDGKRKQISAAKIHKLHEKIIKQGLAWEIIDEEKAKETMNKYE